MEIRTLQRVLLVFMNLRKIKFRTAWRRHRRVEKFQKSFGKDQRECKANRRSICWPYSSSSSIGTETFVGFGLLIYRWVFSAGRFLQSAVASGTSNPQPGGPVIRTFHFPPPGVPHVWNDASEPQQRRVELWARNCREFCRKRRLPRHFWVLLHAINLRHRTDGFTSPPKEGMLRTFSPEIYDGFGRIWTRELGYQRPARMLAVL